MLKSGIKGMRGVERDQAPRKITCSLETTCSAAKASPQYSTESGLLSCTHSDSLPILTAGKLAPTSR